MCLAVSRYRISEPFFFLETIKILTTSRQFENVEKPKERKKQTDKQQQQQQNKQKQK